MTPYRTPSDARLTSGDMVFVGCGGRVAAVKRSDGTILWQHKLTDRGSSVSLLLEAGSLLVGSQGNVWCLDPLSGGQKWHHPNKATGFDSIIADADVVLVGSGGHLWCLDLATGAARWHNGLRGFGTGNLGIATVRSSTHQDRARNEEEAAAADAASAAMMSS